MAQLQPCSVKSTCCGKQLFALCGKKAPLSECATCARLARERPIKGRGLRRGGWTIGAVDLRVTRPHG
eukprot:350709-Chlamydomonas_euryale.AAC.4